MRFIGVARSSGWFVRRAVCSTWQLETAEFLGCIYEDCNRIDRPIACNSKPLYVSCVF